MADTSSKQRMCTYLVKYVTFNMHLISRERHFHLQIMAHVHSQLIFTISWRGVRKKRILFVSKPW